MPSGKSGGNITRILASITQFQRRTEDCPCQGSRFRPDMLVVLRRCLVQFPPDPACRLVLRVGGSLCMADADTRRERVKEDDVERRKRSRLCHERKP